MSNFLKKLIFVLIGSLLFASSACVKEGEEDFRYKQLAKLWLEVNIVTNGESVRAPGKQHIFFSNLKYRRICAINEYCPAAPDGDWSLLSDSTLQTIYNTEINIYTIKKLDNTNLWLEYTSGKNKILLQMQAR